MQALCLATELVAKRLEHLLEDGAHLVYIDDSTSRLDIDSLRSVLGIRLLVPMHISSSHIDSDPRAFVYGRG